MKKHEKFVKQLGFIPPPYGGVSVYVKRLTARLNNDGYITGAYYIKGVENEIISNSPLYDSFEWLSTKKLIPRFIRLMKETRQYKIVHSHFGLEGLAFLWGLSVFCKKKIVITIHNSWVGNTYASTNIINRFFMKQIAHSDVTWIAVSEQTKKEMKKLPVKFKDITVIPAFIANNSGITGDEIMEESLIAFIKKNRKVIVFYGHNFVLNNGHDVYGFNSAIEMFDLLMHNTQQDISLVMCIVENNQPEILKLKTLAEEKGLVDNVYWQIGAINEMDALWKYTDVYIRPTSTDGDSVAIREALNLGVGVVASDVCPRPHGVIIYKYDNIVDFSDKVNKVLLSDNKEIYTRDYYNEMLDIYKKI